MWLVLGLYIPVSATAGCMENTHSTTSVCSFEKPYMTREYTVDGPGVFKAYTFSGDIQVATVKDTDRVKIELYLDRGYSFWSDSKNIENYRITMEKRGNQIVSSVERKEKMGFFSDKMRFSYKIYLPEKMSTILKTAGGDITVSGLSGRQSLKSNAGDITVDKIRGSIRAFTTGGDIDVSDAEGTIFVQTNGGDIRLDNSRGEIRLKLEGGSILAEHISGTMISQAHGGDIKVHFSHIAKGVDLSTTAGDIFVELPDQAGFYLNFQGSEIKFPSSLNFDGIRKKDSIQGQLNGGGAPVNLSTDYGSVAIKINRKL